MIDLINRFNITLSDSFFFLVRKISLLKLKKTWLLEVVVIHKNVQQFV